MTENVARAVLVREGVVDNTILVTTNEEGGTDFVINGYEVVVLAEDSPVSFGWLYSDGEFSRPEDPED